MTRASTGVADGPVEAGLPVVEVGATPTGLRLRGWSAVVVVVASLVALAAVAWPLWVPVPPAGDVSRGAGASAFMMLLLPTVVLLVLAQLGQRGLDARTLAVLAVLSALNAAIRPALGGGTAGIETVFFTLVLAGRVFGPGFGFLLGCTSMFASALLTGGVGPWLPVQMIGAAWIGMGAGLLPRRARGRAELALLVGFGVLAAYGFGLLTNLWSWPFLTQIGAGAAAGALDYVPGAPVVDNLRRFVVFTLLTSTASFDTGRAVTTSIALLLVGRPVLAVLRRAGRVA